MCEISQRGSKLNPAILLLAVASLLNTELQPPLTPVTVRLEVEQLLELEEIRSSSGIIIQLERTNQIITFFKKLVHFSVL